jgi:hypothetical protein
MTLVGHVTRIGALTLALLVLVVAPARADRSAILAFVPDVTLAQLAGLPGASAGLLNTSQGAYDRTQFLLDVGQGARTSRSAYTPVAVPDLRVDGPWVTDWRMAVARAAAAPATVVPGLLGTAAGGIDFAGVGANPLAIAAADRKGHIAGFARARGHEGLVALELARSRPVVLAGVPNLRQLRELLRERHADTLVLAVAAPPPGPLPGAVLPIAAFGLGAGHDLTSRTTRLDGLVSAIDLGPTLLGWARRDVPGDMVGQPIRAGGALDVAGLTALRERGAVVKGRRYPTLGVLLGGIGLLLLVGFVVARGAGVRWAVRVGALGVLWVLPLLLVGAALEPSAVVESVGVGLGALVLGALTGWLVRWPCGPVVPGVVTLVAYTVDLAFGSPLIIRSLLGSNPLGGSRFYGIGNELEASLPVVALGALAAGAVLIGAGRRSPRLALSFAGLGLLLGLILGWDRLGADAGGVVTVGAGFAVATVLALPGRFTWRRAVLTVAVPVAALGALALLDVITGGEGHFSRLVLRSDGGEALGDALRRRGHLAWGATTAGYMPVAVIVCLVGVVWGVVKRDALLRDVPGSDAWGAALAGSATAGIVGALANDSGPLLLVFAIFVTAWFCGYLRAQGK